MNMLDFTQFARENNLTFTDITLLARAFMHPSYVNEADDGENLRDNERLEFLGDSVVGFVVSEQLFSRFDDYKEDKLTELRTFIVRKETLAKFAKKLKMGEYLMLGKGEQDSDGQNRPSTLCDTFEAVIGAIYLDQGLSAVYKFLLPLMEYELKQVLKDDTLPKDPKSRFQEWAQGKLGARPTYREIDSYGFDHAKTFVMQVEVSKQPLGIGKGNSKQDAQQAAAAMALHRLDCYAPEYEQNSELEDKYPLDDVPVEFIVEEDVSP